jgi:hypothetical protein
VIVAHHRPVAQGQAPPPVVLHHRPGELSLTFIWAYFIVAMSGFAC